MAAGPAAATALHWQWARLDDLGARDLHDWLRLRATIFVVEQRCAYLDPDAYDARAWHLLGRDAAGVLRTGLRLVDPGGKYAEPSIGRVVLDAALRGSGLADALLAEGLRRAAATWPGQGNRISAQAHLQRFYGRHGYAPVGAPYLEDDIPHIEMWRAP